jgi:mRNA-degrading endonuclease RelE of RelBE toxin-antitoxin system
MSRRVEWSGPALRDLGRLDRHSSMRISRAVQQYAETGYGNVLPLKSRDREWRLRVGRMRVLFTVNPQDRSISILRVLPRGSAYRG